ncbi:hypothetical protein PHMEG_00028928 [Phytophthora megakarya]|uniref:Uncharacterized protein n=1 Tax=Phytophthora megakarya TaxID=4795 RepID=A0A225V6D2_9STRA|nr:hypothetical protein PHMEG_00028928 [Phytophthora megakarya]
MTSWLSAHYPDTVDSEAKVMRIPLPKEALLSFFGHICSPAHACDRDNVDSIDFLNWTHNSKRSFAGCWKDMKKLLTTLKKRGLMKINEGKRHLKANGFEMLTKTFMTLEPTTKSQAWSAVLFGWGFFVLMWNVMSRADSVDTIMLQHMEWVDDCRVVEEQGHKGDQTGAEKFGKHVYANPYQPSQCTILALAVHLFSCPERSISGKQQLFIGSDNKDRFGRMLRRVIKSLTKDELYELSCTPEDIGTHSLRKGSSSYALGQVNGPTPVSVYLRMGQSLGRLKDRYIHFGEGADQLCGRMVAGLPFDSEPRCGHNASVIFHEQFLRNNLSGNHPIFKSRVFSANPLLEKQRGAAIIAIGTSPLCGLKATGIPAHLAVAKQVNGLRGEVANFRNKINSLEAKLPNEVASTVVSELRQHFVVNGVAPISLHDLDSKIADLETRMSAQFSSALRAVQLPSNSPDTASTSNHSSWRSWSWNDGKLSHSVPKDWEFPARANVKTLWNLWFFGDKDTGIRPYRLLRKQHDIMPQHRMRHSRVRIVMEYMESLADKAELFPVGSKGVSMMQIPVADKVFDVVLTAMLSQLYSKMPKRAEDLSCGTLYNKLCQYRKTHSQNKK